MVEAQAVVDEGAIAPDQPAGPPVKQMATQANQSLAQVLKKKESWGN